MKIDDALHGISTLITSTSPQGTSLGTAFFYQQLEPEDPTKDKQWRRVEKLWLITNRHVLIPMTDGQEILPETFTFNLRKIRDNQVIWEPIILTQSELLKRARFHTDQTIDVCAIEILDLLTEKIKSGENYLQHYGVSKDNLPGQNKIYPEVASDAVVIGYPRGFYDEFNLYPIVKSGIIASKWGSYFNRNPYFLIDAKLFPGSSGSIVISKPANLVVEDGNVFHSEEKQFAFLGIFSGEPYQEHQPIEFDDISIIRKSGFNVGIVWYGHLVEEIIELDHQFSQA